MVAAKNNRYLFHFHLISIRKLNMTISVLPTSARPYPNVYIVDVTPELAKLWLAVGRFNRRVNYSAVAKYVRQINAGLWRCTH